MVLYGVRGNYLAGGELPLATRKGRQIPNDRRPESAPERLKAAKEIVTRSHLTAKNRSLTSLYNCMGLVFASRRTCIDTDELRGILKDDDYHKLSSQNDVKVGDVVVYNDEAGHVTHVGIVSEIRPNIIQASNDITVLSQWGNDGEYFHRIDDVSQFLGIPSEYWTDRK
jgi:hypothetical protein